MRLAWFSPVPPVNTGIAGRSAELIELLRARGHALDVYVDEPVARQAANVRSAHDFVWRNAAAPYDLNVFQFGNSSFHDYEWPYAVRFPGLVVLHDARLHHARAAVLLHERRTAEYRAEFAWNHPHLSPDLAELAVKGLDSVQAYDWPMIRTLVAASKLVAVHGSGTAADLRERFAGEPDLADAIVPITLGEGEPVDAARRSTARAEVRRTWNIPQDAVVIGVFGGLTPEKRLDPILRAFAASRPSLPGVHLLLAGAPAPHYDVRQAIAALALGDAVTVTGYLEGDAALTDHMAACDATLHLRWPTTRETSGPWLRALAAGRATVITDLVHLGDVPTLDPRIWRPNGDEPPISVAIDILDEEHSLRLAIRRLALDPALRDRLGSAAAAWWQARHTVARMADDYERIMELARERPAPGRLLPAHLRDRGDATLRALMAPFGSAVSECIREISGD